MKKNIFIVLCMIVAGSVVYQPALRADEHEDVLVHECDTNEQKGDEQFDDFFGSSDEQVNQPERPKKEKWSKARIMMVRLGVAAVMGVQGFYAWLNSVWAYVTSWVTCEERKA